MAKPRKPPAAKVTPSGSHHKARAATSYLLPIALAMLAPVAHHAYKTFRQTPTNHQPPKPPVVTPPNNEPSNCPSEWKACPATGGVDWVEALARPVPDADPLPCDAEALLSPMAVPGMHVVCVLPGAAGFEATLAVYKDMEKRDPFLLYASAKAASVSQLIDSIFFKAKLPPRKPGYQPAALFTDTGVRVVSLSGVLASTPQRLILIEGGQWLWPPVDVGHVHRLENVRGPGITTQIITKALRPLVVSVENFLSGGEAEHIITRARPHIKKSGVALKDADKGKAAKEFRTSSQYFLPTDGDSKLEEVDRRVMELTRVPISHAEYIQVLRYEHMQHYSAHHDFFDPKAYRSNPEMLQSVEHGAKNRLATVFFYLNNVSAGGQTNFPRAYTPEQPHGGPQPRDYFDCSKGLSVYPQEGKIIIFYSLLPNGEQDDYSLHGGCDVLNAEETKWSANFWLWNKPYHFNSPARKKQTAAFTSKYR